MRGSRSHPESKRSVHNLIIQEFTEKYCGFRGSLFSIHPLSGCERLRCERTVEQTTSAPFREGSPSERAADTAALRGGIFQVKQGEERLR